jgi:RHS repeat-associated protein
MIQDQAGNAVWRNDNTEPFGDSVPNENPSGLGAFEFPLRFPGQYEDQETGLAYNMMRDYYPTIGRYVQSDPIGLRGGVNTYSYALQNPVQYIDVLGLDVNFCYYPDGITHIGFGIVGEDGKTQGFYPKKNHSPRGPGIVKPDPNPGDEPRECKTVVATPEQDKCMLACRERRKSNPGTYNGLTRQCTDFIRDCALQCKVPVGNNGGPLPKWFYDGIKASGFPE